MERRRIVTTSWDDGEQSDLKLAELLRARDIGGTFYVPILPYQNRPSLPPSALQDLLSEGFEIGAHGYSHKYLWKLSKQELMEEINPCKPVLEDILGSEVQMFCYPRGRYDANAIQVLKEAGYAGARTVRMLATELEFDAFEMPTTLQVSPHAKFSYMKNVARGRKIKGVQVFLANLSRVDSWLELGKKLFDTVLEKGGIWHLYGHSREIEELGMWDGLQEILDYVCHRKDVTYVPNRELLNLSFFHSAPAGIAKS